MSCNELYKDFIVFKICIWMNIPSHYQSAFFQSLAECDQIDLRVVYFNGASAERAAEGWKSSYYLKPYESFASAENEPEKLLADVPDAEHRIHIISSYFSSDLVDWFCKKNIRWCHWSEMPGIRLAQILKYRMGLFQLLNPLMLTCKRAEGKRIADHALGAFGQGVLARRAFRWMGVPNQKVADLYYSPSALMATEPSEKIVSFAKGRKVFLAVGALNRRKGIDILINAYARLKTEDWCLVLCGLDQSGGAYAKQIKRLNLQGRVLLLGAYPADRIAEVYSAADVAVLSSRFDGWGAVLNEAASLGIPSIATTLCGASWHVIDEGRSGYRVKVGSVSALSNAMKAYIDHAALAGQHGAEARKSFDLNFTPAVNAERFLKALENWTTS